MQVLHVWPWQVRKDATNDAANFQNPDAFPGLLSWYSLLCRRSPVVLFFFWIRGTNESAQGLWTVCQEDGRQTITSSSRRGKWFLPLLIRRVGPCSSWDVWVPAQQATTLNKADQELPLFTYRTSCCKILFRFQTQRWPSTHVLASRLDYCNSFFVDLNQDSFRKPHCPEHHRQAFNGNSQHITPIVSALNESFVLILNILVLTFRVTQAP